MPLGSGIRTTLALIEEVTFGVTPAGTLTPIRHTKANLNVKKDGFSSEEIRSDRQRPNFRHGFRSVEGSIECELSSVSHDALYEGSLGGAWAAGVSVGTVTAVASGNKYTRASGSWLTDGYLPGDVITVSGFGTSGNNGTARVVSVSATDLAILSASGSPTFGKTLTNDTGGTVLLTGKKLKAGSTLKTYSIQQGFDDVAQYRMFTGIAVNSLELKFDPKGINMGTFNLVGKDGSVFQGTTFAASAAIGTTNPIDSFVGTTWEAGTSLGIITALSAKVENGRTVEGVLGSKVTPAMFEGQCKVSGSMTVFFQDATQYNKFINETASSVDILALDVNGTDFLRFVFPALKYSTGTFDIPANGPIHISMDFESYLDTTSSTSFYMQRSNA